MPDYGARVDVQFWAPPSFSLLFAGLSATDRHIEAQAFTVAYEVVADFTCMHVGRVLRHRQQPSPAFVTNESSEDEPFSWHHHVVVDGLDLDDVAHLEAVVERTIWGAYLRKLRELTTPLGITWGRPEPGAPYEVTSPPLHGYLLGEQRGPCTGVPAGHRLVLPSPAQRHVQERRRADIAARCPPYEAPSASF